MPNNHTQQRIYHYRSSAITNSEIEKPNANNLDFGEIAINYNAQEPSLFIKQNNSEIAQFVDKKYIEDNINSLNGLNDVNISSPKDEQSLVYDSVNNEYINKYALAGAIPYGRCDSSSTSKNFTATVSGITELKDGTCMLLKNGVVTSTAGFTINVNGLGAKPVYNNMASVTAETTLFDKNYTILFIYDETRVSGGCWIYYRGYNENTTYTNVALGQGYASSIDTTSSTAKTATLSNYKLTDNGIVSVKFSGDVPANATLNINGAGAKQIYYKGAQITNGVIKAGDTATFMYNTYYHLLTIDRWNSDFSGNYNDLTNKPELSTVATSGSYNDLSNKPTIGNGALTIKRNGTSLGSFSANQTDNKEIDISVPTKTSDLTNDSNYINSAVTSLKNFATSANVVTALDNKVDKVDGKGLSTNDYTNDEKNKLGGIEANAQKNGNAYKLIKVNATGANLSATTSADTFTISAGTNITLTAGTKKVTISAKDTIPGTLTTTATTSLTTATNESLSGSVSLHKVSKTGSYNDLLNKPTIPTVPTKVSEFENDANYITSAVTNLTNFATSSNTVSALNNKVDKVSGKGLSTNDFDNAYKGKLDNIASGAEVNVQSDWNVSDSNSDAYIKNKPTIGNAALTIQKNGTNVGSFSANQTTNKTINIVVPTTASDVNALPDSTKYAASLSLDINSSTYVVTAQLKDQEGNNLGTQQTIDLPLETMVVSGSYISSAKTVSLVLQNGNKIEFSVADLVSGLQTEITDSNKLSADLIENGNTNKVFTSSEKTKLSNLTSSLATTSASGYMSSTQVTKLNGIESGAEVNVQSDWNETNSGSDAYILNKPTKLSQLTNDSGFITSAVTAMTNYATSANVVSELVKKVETFECEFTFTPNQGSEEAFPKNCTITCNKTISEIASAVEDGKIVIATSDLNDLLGISGFCKSYWELTNVFDVEMGDEESNVQVVMFSVEVFYGEVNVYFKVYGMLSEWVINDVVYSKDLQKLTNLKSVATGGTLDDLDDVVIYNSTSGQVLQYSGSKWVNKTLPSIPDVSNFITSSATVNALATHAASASHITTSERTTWNGKQDAISDLAQIRSNAASGYSAYTGFTAHSTNTTIHLTSAEKTKLDSIESGAEVNIQSDWNVTDSSSDAYIQNKPTKLSDFTNDSMFITSAVTAMTNYATSANVVTVLDNKVDKVTGKGLSTNDYTTDEKNKLANIQARAEVNQNAFSNITYGDDKLKASSTEDTLQLDTVGNIKLELDSRSNTLTLGVADKLSVFTNDAGYINSAVTSMTNYATSANVVTALSGKTSQTINVTHSQLRQLINNSALIPGQSYRITDYTTTTGLANTSVAGHDFDIVVVANSISTLDCKAKAIQHSGDTYFNGDALSRWQIWYDIDNELNKYNWADYTTGKGVIYRMIDEVGNDCPYDFKNILFSISGKPANAYTFTLYKNGECSDFSVTYNGSRCRNNIIKKSYDATSLSRTMKLGFNVFYLTNEHGISSYNFLDCECQNNIFSGDSISFNILERDCYNNNICGNRNHFSINCHDNTLLYGCMNNIFATSCTNNTLGNNCSCNTFGNGCQFNTLGGNSNANTFGNYSTNITFGNGSNQYGKFIENVIIGNGCEYIKLYNSNAANQNNILQNISIAPGVKGTISNNIEISTISRNLAYATKVARNSKGELKIYNEADLVL